MFRRGLQTISVAPVLKSRFATTMSAPGGSNTSPFFSQSGSRSTTREPPKSLKQKLEKTDKKPTKRSKGANQDQDQDAQQPIQAAHSLATTFKKKDVNCPPPPSDPEKPKWEPKAWRIVLEKLRVMRESRTAPVDTMGCHKCADETASPAERRFHILVALMLSSQTKDEVTFEAMKRLRDHGLTPDNIAQTDVDELAGILKPVGFHKVPNFFLIS